ncbi:MAG: hypothetical protein DI538_19650 [Azospira oryzae]|nr:MAG: hypothetical protein DI538_19650 [Azospira oryzae]
MKSERFTLFVLLVEIVVIGVLHTAKTSRPQTPTQTAVTTEQKPPAQATYQWNNNFTLIRLK